MTYIVEIDRLDGTDTREVEYLDEVESLRRAMERNNRAVRVYVWLMDSYVPLITRD